MIEGVANNACLAGRRWRPLSLNVLPLSARSRPSTQMPFSLSLARQRNLEAVEVGGSTTVRRYRANSSPRKRDLGLCRRSHGTQFRR